MLHTVLFVRNSPDTLVVSKFFMSLTYGTAYGGAYDRK